MKKIALYATGIIVVAIVAAAIWMLGPALLPPKPVDTGIAVGKKAPIEMALQDSKAAPTTLGAQMGENGMVLFLVRSADWCVFCKAQLARTQDIHAAVSEKGFSLAALSYDDPATLATFAGENGIAYTLLSDKGAKMISALDLRDPQYGKDSFAFGVPLASILFLAPDGTVLKKYVAADFRSRPSNQDVIAMLDAISS
ncbi:MAG: peroxiredoxin family protein [Sphingomonadaceae bacterium]|nr:peroxiredoxin family protein [Sphingomonadaceae bacterium]